MCILLEVVNKYIVLFWKIISYWYELHFLATSVKFIGKTHHHKIILSKTKYYLVGNWLDFLFDIDYNEKCEVETKVIYEKKKSV